MELFKNYRDHLFFIGHGFEGIRDVNHHSSNTATFFPLFRSASKFPNEVAKAEDPLTEDYTEFLSKYESVVYIAFGTMFMPKEEEMLKLIDAIRLADSDKMGFIIALKVTDKYKVGETIAAMELPNVKVTSWAP